MNVLVHSRHGYPMQQGQKNVLVRPVTHLTTVMPQVGQVSNEDEWKFTHIIASKDRFNPRRPVEKLGGLRRRAMSTSRNLDAL